MFNSCLGDDAVLFYTTPSAINHIHLHSLRNSSVQENLQFATAVSAAGRYLYWSEVRDDFQVIMKASVDEYKPQIIVSSGTCSFFLPLAADLVPPL